jgi:hypothetical protein
MCPLSPLDGLFKSCICNESVTHTQTFRRLFRAFLEQQQEPCLQIPPSNSFPLHLFRHPSLSIFKFPIPFPWFPGKSTQKEFLLGKCRQKIPAEIFFFQNRSREYNLLDNLILSIIDMGQCCSSSSEVKETTGKSLDEESKWIYQ